MPPGRIMQDLRLQVPGCGDTWYMRQAERIVREQTVGTSRRRRRPVTSDRSTDSDDGPVGASPFDLLSGIRTSRTVKVNLPTPKVFKGDVADIVPVHYADLDDYIAYIGKTCNRPVEYANGILGESE